jgi:hypothetical protein
LTLRCRALERSDVDVGVAQNAFLEAMLLHARCLLEFVIDSSDGTNIRARDFVEDFRLPESERAQAGRLYNGICTHLSHLSWARTEPPSEPGPWLDSIPPSVLGFVTAWVRALTPEYARRAGPLRAWIADSLRQLGGQATAGVSVGPSSVPSYSAASTEPVRIIRFHDLPPHAD